MAKRIIRGFVRSGAKTGDAIDPNAFHIKVGSGLAGCLSPLGRARRDRTRSQGDRQNG